MYSMRSAGLHILWACVSAAMLGTGYFVGHGDGFHDATRAIPGTYAVIYDRMDRIEKEFAEYRRTHP